MTSPRPVLRVQGLAKRYGETPVFEGVDLELPAGRFIALLGESGVGKSTLLNCLAGLDAPTAGRIEVLGQDLATLDESGRARLRRTHLGFVFQAFHVLPHLSVADNVALPLLLLGMAACVVCARAMLRDLYDPAQGAHVMARAATWMGLLPVAGPILGGYLETTLGWRGAFGVLTLFGATGLAVIALRLPETLQRPNPEALRLRPLLDNWRVVLSHRGFWAYTAVSSFTYAGLFCFIAGSSFVMVDVLGLSRREYGLAFAFVTSGFLIGSAVCRRLVPRRGMVRSIRLAAFVSLAAGTSMAGLALAGVHHPLALMIPAFIYTFAHGIHQPCAQVGAVGPFPTRAGAATALSGFLSMALAFGMGYWMGWSYNGTVYPLSLTIAGWCFALAFAALVGVGRHGHPTPAAVQEAQDNTPR